MKKLDKILSFLRKLFGIKLQQNARLNQKLAENLSKIIENNDLSGHFHKQLTRKKHAN